MTNFDILKQELMNCQNAEQLNNVMEEFRWNLFPCNENEHCIKNYSCLQCYRNWLEKEI